MYALGLASGGATSAKVPCAKPRRANSEFGVALNELGEVSDPVPSDCDDDNGDFIQFDVFVEVRDTDDGDRERGENVAEVEVGSSLYSELESTDEVEGERVSPAGAKARPNVKGGRPSCCCCRE